MLRFLTCAVQHAAASLTTRVVSAPAANVLQTINHNKFSMVSAASCTLLRTRLLAVPRAHDVCEPISRNLVKFSWGKGRRKTCAAVLRRFYRLNWGCWIHAKCGRNKKIWRKHAARKRRLRQHVFCNASQSLLLDKMVNNFWRKPKYYVDDPYEPYHSREEFMYTYKKPREYIPLK